MSALTRLKILKMCKREGAIVKRERKFKERYKAKNKHVDETNMAKMSKKVINFLI